MNTRTFSVALTIFCFFLSGCREQILHDLDEARANRVQLALSRAGINADKVRIGKAWGISVESGLITAALEVVERSRILRVLENQSPEQQGFLQSGDERARAYERQTAARTEETLERIPGVVEARVHIRRDFSSNRLYGDTQNRESASVLLVVEHGSDLNLTLIGSFVAGASGLKAEQISVIPVEIPSAKESVRIAAGKEVMPAAQLLADRTRVAQIRAEQFWPAIIASVGKLRNAFFAASAGALISSVVMWWRRIPPATLADLRNGPVTQSASDAVKRQSRQTRNHVGRKRTRTEVRFDEAA